MNIKQRKILQLLLARQGQRYSDLFRHFEYEDKFPYHLKYLVSKGFVNKRKNLYLISEEGIKYTTFFNTRTLGEIEKKTLRLLFVCNHKNLYLLKPCFESDPKRDTYYILPGGSPIIGEHLDESCAQLLKDKFSVSGKAEYRATHHYLNYTTKGDILFDNLCLIYDVKEDKKPDRPEHWFTKAQIRRLGPRHPTVDRFILEDCREPFSECTFEYDYGVDLKD